MIDFSPELPRVLQPPKPLSALSMERALKQVRDLLETIVDDELQDMVNASIDDVNAMLLCL